MSVVAADLARFVRAQDDRGTHDRALAELRAGRKTGHWMWFVFPQVAGLGHSPTAQAYAVADLVEARAYLAHDVLGPRLHACCETLLGLEGVSAEQVLGVTDAMKLRSSMTLFALAAPDDPVFDRVLDRFFDGERDERTPALLR
ncbi:DUF1810 domain-containing protein [Mycobacterium cookii]|uniref:DUF1810 domain-containing protein n=1 Tax=Nocardioides furvisabuli TaxID=375542 RepID=A0ABP5IMJ0_9ACTN|nr:DUF1810 domain-containing protein [Nocardioides furvisabuli]